MRTHRYRHRFAALISSIAFGALLGCVPEKPPPAPPTPTTARPAPAMSLRDIAGKERVLRRGITPGALEAEGPPPAPPKKIERSTDKS